MSVKFVPNHIAFESTEDLITKKAHSLNQDLESVIIVPFSELEGKIDFPEGFTPVIEEPTRLGEKLADELDTFVEWPISVVHLSLTHVANSDFEGEIATVIDSEETMHELEKKAEFGE